MIRKLLLTFVIVFASFSVFSQSGTLMGKVTDPATKQPLPYANVVVLLGGKIVNGATTDDEGKYTIKPIEPGKYDVKASNIGYKSIMVTNVIISSNIQYQDFKLESTTTELDVVEIKTYANPLLDKGKTQSGQTVTASEIAKMPGRDATSVAVTVGGVFSDENGSMGGIRGGRSSGTATYVDGVRVIGAASIPKAAIDQISVITGGTPAMYGDFTGGIVSITTKGPSREFGAGFEAVTSELLDGYGYNLFGFNVQGPLIKGKDDKKSSALLGFFISGEGSYIRDGSPASIGTYQVNEEMRTQLQKNPFRPSGTGFGIFPNSEYIVKSDLVKNKARVNAENYGIDLQGKIDVRTTENITLTFGGTLNYGGGSGWSRYNSLLNWENNSVSNSLEWRVYGKFTQRFPDAKDSRSLIKNVYYSIQADYSKNTGITQSSLHNENLFNYGYVGKFKTYSEMSYEYGEDTASGMNNVWVHNGWRDTLFSFQASDVNPNLSNYTQQYYNLYPINSGYYRNRLLVQNGGAFLNGDYLYSSARSVYNLWSNTGIPYNGYSKSQSTQFSINATGSADVGKHEIQFGIQYEQRSSSAISYNPAALWTLMRGLTNKHILQLDLANPIKVMSGGVFQDTIYYNRLYDANTQAFFDKNLRNVLGLPVNGTDWIDLDSYDPSTFSIDMFSADELLNSGNAYVAYFGYDHTGKKLTSKPSFDDFFTGVDQYGNPSRTVGAFEPIYMAGYIQDQFVFNDLIFTFGLRVDRYDANQKVLKDPFLLAEAKTVKEVSQIGGLSISHPSNMGEDYVVYVNDMNNPTAINGYRNGYTWYNALGAEVSDPVVLETGNGIAPYLVDPSNTELKASAFKDYDPQTTFMPRISFSFPISDEALFFAHYDVLTSRPSVGNRMNPLDYFFIFQQGTNVIDNPNLRAERTTDYELGFQQKINEYSALKVSAYYRELRDQIQVFRFTDAYPVHYISYNNVDFGTTKGVTAQYDLRKIKNLWLKLTYTLQFSNATGSSSSSSINLVTSGQPNLRTLSPTSQDRNHTISLVADYRYDEGIRYNGPTLKFAKKGSDKVKVIRLLENTGINATFQGGSGVPYSRQSNITSALLGGGTPVLSGSINGSRLPWQFKIDLRIDRDIKIARKEGSKNKNPHYLNVSIQILNVLNTKNIMGVYRYTGNPDDDGYLSAAEFQNAISAQTNEQSFRDMYSLSIDNPYNYSLPRRIRLGLMFSF